MQNYFFFLKIFVSYLNMSYGDKNSKAYKTKSVNEIITENNWLLKLKVNYFYTTFL